MDKEKQPDFHLSIRSLAPKSSNETPDVNFYVSQIKLKDLKKVHKSRLKLKLLRMLGLSRKMDPDEFNEEVTKLYKCCLKSVKDLHELHIKRTIGLEILEDLTLRAKPEYLTIQHVIHVIWSVMSCIHHFQLRVRTETSGIVSWTRQRQAEHCMDLYVKMIKLIESSKYRFALNAILTFYKEGKLWELEFGCTDMIVRLFALPWFADEGIDDLIFMIEYYSLANVEEAKYLTQLLYEILRKVRWARIPEYLLIKLLNMTESSIVPRSNQLFFYTPLRKGLELCLRNVINNLSRLDLIITMYLAIKKINENVANQEIMLCFGNICTLTAYKYRILSETLPLSKGPLPFIFSLFKSRIPIKILIGLKIWQRLMDRKHNLLEFLCPKIFYQECDYKLIINSCKERDKAFFKKVRHLMYQITTNSFVICTDRMGLENIYQSIAITLIEIPCGYTASCFVTVAMTLQEYGLQLSSENLVKSHHIHATVVSILSLICYIHNAQTFYSYVLTIMDRRAEWAPHLNPPIKTHYNYAEHHILWNKPELFFEDWEARYGLWKCFRGDKKPSKDISDK